MKVDVVPHDPAWKAAFERHREVIAAALRNAQPSIDHIGSTALASIAAKPVIDILVGLSVASQLDETVGPLLDAGYAYVEQFTPGMPYRRFFAKLRPLTGRPLPRVLAVNESLSFGRDYQSVAHVHVMVRDSEHWLRHVAFRDYLMAHPEVRAAYEALKLKIAEIDFGDPLEYNAHKDAFIAEYQAKALVWYTKRRRP